MTILKDVETVETVFLFGSVPKPAPWPCLSFSRVFFRGGLLASTFLATRVDLHPSLLVKRERSFH